MFETDNRNDLPVLMLHNLDPAWKSVEIEEASRMVGELESALHEHGHPVTNVPIYNADLSACLQDYDPNHYIVLNWCEELPGVPHSEAMVAHMLSDLDFTYTGSPSEVLALSWNKCKVKQALEQNGVPTPSWRIYDSPQPDGWKVFPGIVKPAKEHCSLGITGESVVLTSEELSERITKVLEIFHQPALVEEFIDGREFHVSLWGNRVLQMLPPTEMDYSALKNVRDRLCTFDSKFRPGSRHYEEIQLQLPAKLERMEYQLLKQEAFTVYQAFGCRDYARLDIRLQNGTFYVIDINPNPDISSETSMAYAAEMAGYPYGAMISRLVNLAAQRHPIYGAPGLPGRFI